MQGLVLESLTFITILTKVIAVNTWTIKTTVYDHFLVPLCFRIKRFNRLSSSFETLLKYFCCVLHSISSWSLEGNYLRQKYTSFKQKSLQHQRCSPSTCLAFIHYNFFFHNSADLKYRYEAMFPVEDKQ